MIKSPLRVCLVLLPVLVLVGCHRTVETPPVAAVVATPSHTRVPLGSPVDIAYQFTVLPTAQPFHENYRVFVHFVDADDELLWADDHFPPVPTTEWKPGQTIKYSRLVFAPVVAYAGDASVEIGLYGNDGKRLTLSGTEHGKHAYRVARLQIAPQSESIYLTFKDGWNLAEAAADNASREWHWTKKEATLSFQNPRRATTFFLEYGAQPKYLTDPQTVTVSVGDQVIDTFQVGFTGGLRRIQIPAEKLGSLGQVELKLAVDRSFVPAVASGGSQNDKRELGLCVFHAFVEAQ